MDPTLFDGIEALLSQGRVLVTALDRNTEAANRVYLELRKLDRHLHPNQLSHFVILQGAPMSTNPTPTPATLAPGQVVKLTAQPVDASGNPTTLPAGVVLNWTSSDPVNVPVTSSGTAGDLTATATVGANPPAETVTFSVDLTAPLADGTNPTGSVADDVTAPPPPPPAEVASFVITQA